MPKEKDPPKTFDIKPSAAKPAASIVTPRTILTNAPEKKAEPKDSEQTVDRAGTDITPPQDMTLTEAAKSEAPAVAIAEKKIEPPAEKEATDEPGLEGDQSPAEPAKEAETTDATEKIAEKSETLVAASEQTPESDKPDATKPPAPPTADTTVELPPELTGKQYHLPINVRSYHHKSRGTYWLLAVFLVLLIVGIFAAADAGLIDLGFKLPFDFIK